MSTCSTLYFGYRSVGVFVFCGLAVISISGPYMLVKLHKLIKGYSRSNIKRDVGEPMTSVFEIKDNQLFKLVSLEQLCTTQVAMLPNRRLGVWYLTTGTGQDNASLEISSFGAYLDTRGANNMVRVFGVSNTNFSMPVYCQLWYKGQEAAIVINATVEDTGRGIDINTSHFQERMYNCILPYVLDTVPTMVSLAFVICDTSEKASPIPVQVALSRTVRRHEIGLCTAVTYGSVDSLKLIEWIEFNSMLGITEINFYVNRLAEGTEKVLRYYEQAGLIRVQRVAPPIVYSCYWCLKLATIAILNDCMYRNMYRYKYTLVIDIDELIIPRRHTTLTALVSHLDVFHPSPAYMFRNAYFFLDLPSAEPENKKDAETKLTTIVKLYRMKPSNLGYAMKSIVDPRLCIVMQNHYCMKRTADVSTRYWATVVKEDVALLHHYKKCHFQSSECKQITDEYITDKSTLRFRDELLVRVKDAVKYIKNSTQQDAQISF